MSSDPPEPSGADTIVLIHGLWMTPRSWEHWIERYSARGYKVLAAGWPGMDAEVEQLRRDSSQIATLSTGQIVDHYERMIRELPQPPIIMGHSFGGAFTQLLLDRGLGAAGVAISSAPTKGILKLPLATIRSAMPILRSPFNRGKAVMLNPKQFHYSFTNTLSEEASLPVYERYAVPGVGRVLFEGALANLSPKSPFKIDYRRPTRAPLLLIGGGVDHVVPAAVVKTNAGKYLNSTSVTEYKEYPDRSHYILGQDGWERIADEALAWAAEHAGTANRGGTGPGVAAR